MPKRSRQNFYLVHLANHMPGMFPVHEWQRDDKLSGQQQGLVERNLKEFGLRLSQAV